MLLFRYNYRFVCWASNCFLPPKKKSKKIDAVDPKQKTRKGKDSLMKYKQKKV